jgi:hypothetical protein
MHFQNPTAAPVGVEMTSTGTSPPAAAPPLWAYAVEFAASGTLGAVGAVALFLGFFLRPGVYARPPMGGSPPETGVGPPPGH